MTPEEERATILGEVRAAARDAPSPVYFCAAYFPTRERSVWITMGSKGWVRRIEEGPGAGPAVYLGRIGAPELGAVARVLLDQGFPDWRVPDAPPEMRGYPWVALQVSGSPAGMVEIKARATQLARMPAMATALDAIYATARRAAERAPLLAAMVDSARGEGAAVVKPAGVRVLDALDAVAVGAEVNRFVVSLELPVAQRSVVTRVSLAGEVDEGIDGAEPTRIGVVGRDELLSVVASLLESGAVRAAATGSAPVAEVGARFTIRSNPDLELSVPFALSALDHDAALRRAVWRVGAIAETAAGSASGGRR